MKNTPPKFVSLLPSRYCGYSLIEMIVTVGLLGMATAFAAPSFSEFLQRQGVRSATETITSSISEARSHALTRLTTVTMCWNGTDQDALVDGVNVAARTVISFIPAVAPSPAEQLSERSFGGGSSFIQSNDDGCVAFNSQGRLLASSAPNAGLFFGVCQDSGGSTDDSLVITVGPSGRAATAKNTGAVNAINCSG